MARLKSDLLKHFYKHIAVGDRVVVAREAEARGLDPNVWFNNVERIASERIGRETVTYVSNIYKYYVTYLLIQGEYMQRQNIKKDR